MDRPRKKAPPTHPHLPPASEADPGIPGIRIVSSEGGVDRNSWVFSVIPGQEDAAINGLLDALDRFDEFLLSDRIHDDDDFCGIYRKEGGHYAMRIRGQGWRGEWKPLDRDSAFADARKRIGGNFGPPWGEYGRIHKRPPAVPERVPEAREARNRSGVCEILMRFKALLLS